MKKTYKYYASACSTGHGNFLDPLGFESTNKLEEADVIIFGGGADIDPAQYGEAPGGDTYASPEREKIERADYERGKKLGKKFLGICRGIQLLNTLAGGKLIQHVTNHAGSKHEMATFDGMKVTVNSIHHQMVNPHSIKDPKAYRLLGWVPTRRSDRYLGAKDKTVYLPWSFKEPEAVFYPKINAIGFQFHPEMMFRDKTVVPAVSWSQNTFMKFFNNSL